MNAKKVGVGFLVFFGGIGTVLALVAARYEPVAAKGTKLGLVPIGGLTRDQAAFRLRQWWESEKTRQLTLRIPNVEETLKAKPSELGISLDDQATADQAEYRDFWESAQDSLGVSEMGKALDVKFKYGQADLKKIRAFCARYLKPPTPARIEILPGGWKRHPEIPGMALDETKLGELVVEAIRDGEAELPFKTAEKKITDEQLNSISKVYAQYTTRFSEGNVTRASNIRNAAGKISGIVLAPGDVFSFNGTVGRRTIEAGFKIAGVYKNGKHDVDLGGGICQVSTTLYNAALLANLKIKQRSNHSMPVAYVPRGRDATVDYGNIDLQIENNTETPIALVATVGGGSINFKVLADREADFKVEIESFGSRAWGAGESTVKDPSLPAGKTKVIERGCSGSAISTTRVVYRNGKEVSREKLGESYYRGAKRVVAVGTRAAAPQPVAPPTAPPNIPETAPPDGDM